MMKKIYKKLFSLSTAFKFTAMVLGIVYYLMIQVDVGKAEKNTPYSDTFTFSVYSAFPQEVKLHIAAQNVKLRSVECADSKVHFSVKKKQWFEGLEEQVTLSLKKGENHCKVRIVQGYRNVHLKVKQKITNFDYVILFVLLVLPLFHLMFTVFMYILDQIKSRTLQSRSLLPEAEESVPSDKIRGSVKVLYALILAGVLIRVFYFNKFGIMNFQHDWQGHIEFIKYIAEHWTLPLASKGLEYPQQPLYYWINGGLYALFTHFGLSAEDALYGLGFFSLFCSMVFLYYSYRFMKVMTKSIWVQTIAMVFVTLTPSLVYLSARINNDALVMALSALSLYYIVKSYHNGFRNAFYAALTGVSLLFMTKISAASVELLFFALLLLVYFREKKGKEALRVKRDLYLFAAVGLFLLGVTFLRVYLPVEGAFHLVNSSGRFPGQIIEALDLDYFGTFHIGTLIHTGSSYVFGEDLIRFSFLTYQYGTMFFGEFDYAHFLQRSPALHDAMQAVLLFGLVFLLGFVLYVITLYRRSLLHKLLFATLFLNLLLILKFMFDYPSVCNTDFRYFVSSFVLLAFFFAKGLEPLNSIKYIGTLISVWVGLLAVSEVVFFMFLIV